MKEILSKLVSQALHSLFGISDTSFVIEHPKELSHGDYATNAALVVAKQLGKNPKEVAEALVGYLNEHKGSDIESVSIAGPGFINFTLKRDVFVKGLADAHGKEWGNTEVYKGEKILVEHSSPNLFKPFHIGHLMNNTIGEAITRLAKSSGADVDVISFPSDISLGVAKAVAIAVENYPQLQDWEIFLSTSNHKGSVKRAIIEFGIWYVIGTERFENDSNFQIKVKEIADDLYAKRNTYAYRIFEDCKKENITYFEEIVAQLGSHFDSYIYESEAGIDGIKIVKEYTPKVFTESDGAIVYIPDESKKSLHTAVFVNSQGNPTYEAKDIGLLDLKFKKYHPDLSIFITDAQQVSHFAVVLDAAAKINTDWSEKSLHRYHGRMSFKGQKMSSRLGGVPLAEDVLDAVAEEAKKRLVPSGFDLNGDPQSEEQLERFRNTNHIQNKAQDIAIAAIKFTILRTAAGKDINFDPDTSLSFEGDSGPYLQYTAVRAGSLLEKGITAGITPDATTPVAGTETLERLIARLPEVITLAQHEWAPHHLVVYLLDLAQAFNYWYGQGKIIDQDVSATAYRLVVVAATRQTLMNGLDMLGIQIPERM